MKHDQLIMQIKTKSNSDLISELEIIKNSSSLLVGDIECRYNIVSNVLTVRGAIKLRLPRFPFDSLK